MTDVARRLREKLVPVEEALSHVRSGSRIFLGSGGAEPQTRVRGLCDQAERLRDVEVCSLLTLGAAEHVKERFLGHFRHNAYVIGANVRGAVRQGRADYTPIFLSEIPELLHTRQHRPDVALVQLSPPDAHGNCSLGIHVDIQLSAIERARLVIAELNPNMPFTSGNSTVPLDSIDWCVETRTPLLELPYEGAPDDIALEIGMHVARLISNGSCLQLGIGGISDAVSRFLDDRHHLGVHTEMFSDGLLPLIENGNIDNSRKSVLPGKTVTSFTMGSRRLYDFVNGNESIEFHPSDFVNDPRVICRNDRMVAINSALEVDLTGQVCADSLGYSFYSGIGGQVDFVRGAAMSKGGKPIIAIPSTAKGGAFSRIVPRLTEGAGVVTSRGDVHWVVTEYGAAYLHGKTIRERALALADIAHPDFRRELLDHIREKHYGFVDPAVFRRKMDAYPEDWIRQEEYGDDSVTIRPLRPEDSGKLRDFFYTHSLETVYHRYFTVKKDLTPDEALHLCSVDYMQRMAFAGFVGEEDPQIVAVGRYDLHPRSGMAETALVVGEDWRARGIGSRLLTMLCEYARAKSIRGIRAEIAAGNQGMVRIHQRLGHEVKWSQTGNVYRVTHTFPAPDVPGSDRTDNTGDVSREAMA